MKNLQSQLFAKKNGKDLGLIATKVVTTAFYELLIDALQSNVDLSTFKWHGSGTGTTAPVIADTTLEAEVESRESGTQTEHDSTTYESVAEITYSASYDITEHGIFSDVGVLLDRSVFDAISVSNGSVIEFTYRFNPAGVTSVISICDDVCNDLNILNDLEKLNQYLRAMAPALYSLGIDTQSPEIFQRQFKDLHDKIPDLEDSDLARRSIDLRERRSRGL